jgi:hypothetical protein
MSYNASGPFLNPAWSHAAPEDQKNHDKWCYYIDGQRFTHPTHDGAVRLLTQPERHDCAAKK